MATIGVISALGCGWVQAMDSFQMVLEAPDSSPLQHAAGELKSALLEKGFGLLPADAPGNTATVRLVAGLADYSQTVDSLLKEHQVILSEVPESLLIKRLTGKHPVTILLAGRDERGLVYALYEVAQAIRVGRAVPRPASAGSVVPAVLGGTSKKEDVDVFAGLVEGSESPFLKVRSLSVHLLNADLEREWYFSEDYWRQYFAMLIRNRFNTFILRFADQTNYMAPPYPWLFDLPDYPEVHVEGLSKDEQARNLAMLRRIGELATEYGLDFAVAIWQQQPVLSKNVPAAPYAHNYGPSALRNPPGEAKLADYGPKALARLLKECPSIRRLQLRLNYESGIPEAIQPQYFRALFAVLTSQPRPVQLDLRYKGLSKETVDQAAAAGLDVTISTKFWCEHFGLPFHPTTQDPLYSANRYGYGTMLHRPRNYRVAYQLWNQGSNRILTWGDPDYAARFTESCALGDGEGFEVFAPLTDRGWGNEPGAWRLLAKRELEYFRWESERYWPFYLAFGRMGYNPKASEAVWKREWVARFGAAAEAMERACRSASRVLPLLTATTMTSASEWSYWTEMDLCGPLDLYSVVPPSDYGQFYGIRAWKALPGWKDGSWSGTPRGFVEDALAGDVEAKWTPFQVSRELDRLADEVLTAVDAARKKLATPSDAEFRSVEVDLRALAYLARYHAAKKRAATHLAFFYATQEAGRLVRVCEEAEAAAKAWESLAQVTDGVYSDNLVFGRSREQVGTPAKPVNAHAGHWKDRLPNVRADVEFAKGLLARHNAEGQAFHVYPGEVPPVHPPVISHTPVTATGSGTDLVIDALVQSEQPLKKVLLRFRPMDQTKAWTVIPMEDAGKGHYRATISSRQFDANYDLLYFLEARVEGGGTLWPNWQDQTPYVKVKVRKE